MYIEIITYSEMLGDSKAIDIINIDLGNGDTCPARFLHLNRNYGNYQHAFENSLVKFDRSLTSGGEACFQSCTKHGGTDFRVVYPSSATEHFLLITKIRKYHYVGRCDDCYLPYNTFKDVAEEDLQQIMRKAFSEIGLEINVKVEDFLGKSNLAEVNAFINELDVEEYSCEIKKMLIVVLVFSYQGDYR
ncbi:hypothetical protein [Vreelandella titanicae]|uniref:hypothetical protein n=1 Tax=Vreelandella titanicae TaxID=664683 RepID=UPI003819BAAF